MAAETQECPVEPEFRAAQRANVVLRWFEADEWQSWAGDAWARLDGPWVHVHADEFGHWQTWPATAVVCVGWELPS